MIERLLEINLRLEEIMKMPIYDAKEYLGLIWEREEIKQQLDSLENAD